MVARADVSSLSLGSAVEQNSAQIRQSRLGSGLGLNHYLGRRPQNVSTCYLLAEQRCGLERYLEVYVRVGWGKVSTVQIGVW